MRFDDLIDGVYRRGDRVGRVALRFEDRFGFAYPDLPRMDTEAGYRYRSEAGALPSCERNSDARHRESATEFELTSLMTKLSS